MKNSIKSLELVEKGLSPNTVSKLTESQINVLHSKLINEQSTTGVTTKTVTKPITTVSDSALTAGVNVNVDGAQKKVKKVPGGIQIERELDEKKDDKPNPWAICHSKLGRKKNAKFESCVRQVKKSLQENQNDVSSFLENKIVDLLEKYLPPKITKGDLIKYLVEDSPAVAPKPGTKEPKPGTKEPPKPTKKPSHPGKNPNPKVNPAPKAKKIDPEVAKEKIIDTIMKMLENEKN